MPWQRQSEVGKGRTAMRDLLIRYIDGLIPLAGGIVAYFFPQLLTRADLARPENAATARRFKRIGLLLLAVGLMLMAISAFDTE
jgi:hypothetical protein